jgi:hypothetical protein
MARGQKKSAGLFDAVHDAHRAAAQPLAARMRPRTLDEFVGQEHFLGPGKLLRRLLQADRLSSVIFFGPPGCGKTSLAHVVARQTRCAFRPLNAVAAGIKEVRELLVEARATLEETGRRTVLFVDELHHFNRSQQDILLPDVEEGQVILLGTTRRIVGGCPPAGGLAGGRPRSGRAPTPGACPRWKTRSRGRRARTAGRATAAASRACGPPPA